ncbi:DUF664 domain-containing protein [Amycolatopsis rhizosphaerae]|uniref:DUF664 domain-containing protein n=1 Tax=Amycolatopsis rhizosphaerae TaxID=2053003 RepID=A0A558B4U3_9PSEU|nr:DUF664 domain-containing protein [Amycolatopsis rhizosphaerae]
MLAKLDGLSEYDIRRPLTATGTNLLGLTKHLSTWEARYFGEVFSRPFPEPLPERGTDMWATEHETRTQIIDRPDTAFWENRRAEIERIARAADPAEA